MLKRVSIQNFKSLKDVTLDLQKVNLLIGPNNSGKTNFLKALEYFGKTNEVHSEESNRNRIAYKHSTHDTIKIEFKFKPRNTEFSFSELEYYVFECKINPNGTVMRSNLYHDLNQPGIEIYSAKEKLFEQEDFEQKVGPLTIYRPDPNQFIQPADFSADEIKLNGDCSNLIAFLFYLNTNHKRLYQQIEKDLAKCVGDIVSFSTPPVKVGEESKLGLKFFGKNDEDYWAQDVSEGVLYFLAFLTIINQPNPPKLLLLEEPEKGIHPRRIWEVMKLIFQLAEEKDIQIILTTHNEHVVNAFSTMPESVFVFDKDEESGATTVRNLQKDIIEPSHQKSEELELDKIDFTSDLGERWMYGLIGGVPADQI